MSPPIVGVRATTVAGVLAILRFSVDESEDGFAADAQEGLAALAACPGYLRGQLARAYDDPTGWCLITEWASVGAYRRALSSYDVKLRATVLLSRALPEASAFEPLASVDQDGVLTVGGSDRAGPIAFRP